MKYKKDLKKKYILLYVGHSCVLPHSLLSMSTADLLFPFSFCFSFSAVEKHLFVDESSLLCIKRKKKLPKFNVNYINFSKGPFLRCYTKGILLNQLSRDVNILQPK